VVGENQKFAAALIVPNFEHIKSWCSLKGIECKDKIEMITHPEFVKIFKKEVNDINQNFGSYEQIKKYKIMEKEWSIETRELTANLKLRRKYIFEKYEDVIESLFK